MDKNMANRMCCDLDIRDYYTKAPIMKVDFCNTTTYGFTSDSVYANVNGAKYVRYDAPIEGNISITFQVHPFQIYSLLNNGSISTDGIVSRYENILASDDGKLLLKYQPIAGSVFVYTDSNFTGKEVVGTTVDKTFTSDTLSDIESGKIYYVGYLERKTDGVKRISFSNSDVSSMYFIQMITMNKTEYGEESALRLTAYKCCPKHELEITFSSYDSPAEITMSFECFQDENSNVMDIMELTDNEIIEEDVENIWINFSTGTLETYSSAYYVQNGYLYQNEEEQNTMAVKNLGKVFITPKGVWEKSSSYTKLDLVTNKVNKISYGYIATADIPTNTEITDSRWMNLYTLYDGDVTDEYKKLATSISENKNSVDEIYNKLQLLCGVEITDSMPTNTQTGLWINPTSNESINIPELKDNVVNTTDTWSSKKIYDEIQVLTNKLNTLETKTQTVSDEDADTYLGVN